MAGKSKIVKKAEKATVRAAATGKVVGVRGSQEAVIKDLSKSIKAGKKAGTKISAGSVPGSVADRNSRAKGDGSKRSSAKKTLAKRVNQSAVARGGSPRPLYVSKAKAAETAARMAKAGKKEGFSSGKSNPSPPKKQDLSKKKLDGRGGYN